MAKHQSTSERSPGKRGFTGCHNNHWHPVGRRVSIACEVCGAVREYLESTLRVRKVIRFCSTKCRDLGRRTRPDVACGFCGKVFRRVGGPMREVNYCGRPCAAASRRKERVKWPDKARGLKGDREAMRAYHRNYSDSNRVRVNELHARWRRANRRKIAQTNRRRRAVAIGAEIGAPVNFERIMVRDRMRCHLCGKRVVKKSLHFDHVIPLAAGGSHLETNIAVAHGRCNQSKGAKALTLF